MLLAVLLHPIAHGTPVDPCRGDRTHGHYHASAPEFSDCLLCDLLAVGYPTPERVTPLVVLKDPGLPVIGLPCLPSVREHLPSSPRSPPN